MATLRAEAKQKMMAVRLRVLMKDKSSFLECGLIPERLRMERCPNYMMIANGGCHILKLRFHNNFRSCAFTAPPALNHTQFLWGRRFRLPIQSYAEFSDGRLARSITITSAGTFLDSSFSPSFSCNAVKMLGPDHRHPLAEPAQRLTGLQIFEVRWQNPASIERRRRT